MWSDFLTDAFQLFLFDYEFKTLRFTNLNDSIVINWWWREFFFLLLTAFGDSDWLHLTFKTRYSFYVIMACSEDADALKSRVIYNVLLCWQDFSSFAFEEHLTLLTVHSQHAVRNACLIYIDIRSGHLVLQNVDRSEHKSTLSSQTFFLI